MLGVGRAGAFRDADPEAMGIAVGGMASGDRISTTTGDQPPGSLDGDERDAWVVLDSVIGVGPVSFARLIAAFGEAREVLEAARGPRGATVLVAASAGLDDGSPTLSRSVAEAVVESARSPRPALAALERAGVRAVTLADADYPSRLRRIELPPPVLYVAGAAAALDRPRAIAIVGTRRPTAVGRATSGRIADAVAILGATVVSGLALGIDAAAHTATLRSAGTTVAVIGGGHLRLYPAAHRHLARAIVAQGGAVISEFPPETMPSRGTFPRRNRIISGLADATVVVEAGARSGALTTAAWALEQGRGLHIVPGRLDDPAVAGCLAFLREAGPEARIVAGIGELIEDLGLLPALPSAGRGRSAAGKPPPAQASRAGAPAIVVAALPAAEREVAVALVAGRGSVDELVAETGQTGATVLGALTGLELRGLVMETFGRYRPAGALASSGATSPSGAARAIRSMSGRSRGARGEG
jgi:DNA processing protein